MLRILLLSLLTSVSAFADVDADGLGPTEPRIGDVVGFDDSGEPIYLGGKVEDAAEVYRGTKSVAGEFPTSGWIGNCTANAVALDVVITAGHCKGTGARITFAHRGTGKNYAATCTRHPRYNSGSVYNDYTLCKLDTPLPAGNPLISFPKTRVPVGTDTWVNGFGAPNVGVHYWGLAKISGTSGNQDLKTCGPANLGGGDSGGTLMVNTGDRNLPKGGDAIAVNSRGNSSCSWYNDYAHSEFQSWAREYETAKGVKLCGISADCKKPVEPVDCLAVYQQLGVCMRAAGVKSSCLEAYEKFKGCLR